MLSFQHQGTRLCDGLKRREWLQVGSLGTLGLTLPQLLAGGATQAASTPRLASGLDGAQFGRAKNVIYLWLQGGPPQHETFDPKPEAPLEIRGPFAPIQTNIPGIQFSELLPRTAQRADKLAVIRSLCTDDNNHDVSGYWVLTGYPYGPGSARQIKPTDWPYMGSVIKKLKPSERLPALTSVWLPDMMRLNDNVTPAGQTGGFLGSMWDPERFVGDPAAPDYRIEGLSLPVDLSPDRMNHRSGLLNHLDQSFRRAAENTNGSSSAGLVIRGNDQWDELSRLAMNLVTSGQAKEAFDLTREPAALRDRYGRHSWGQSCLLARRLVEAGVRLVHVNWPREPGDNAVNNPMWDTHEQNADRLQDVLCPLFDATFAALLDDLDNRGLLSETLVVAIGEFGRTPKINRAGGRDHWGPVFSGVLAGAGISGGQVFGASDKNGAYPAVDPIRPHDLTATIFHLLGIRHDDVFLDRTNRPQPVTRGEPLYRLLGEHPATAERCVATGDESFVPEYDTTLLIDTDFRSGRYFSATAASRQKGWRVAPLPEHQSPDAVGLFTQVDLNCPQQLRMGVRGHWNTSESVDLTQPTDTVTVEVGHKLVLAQEIKNARGGHYTLTASIKSGGSSAEVFERLFGSGLVCRLELFRYANMKKSPLETEVLAVSKFVPTFDSENPDSIVQFQVSEFLGSKIPGVNFATGNGLGVALIIECAEPLNIAAKESAWLQVHSVALEFQAHQRNNDVTV